MNRTPDWDDEVAGKALGCAACGFIVCCCAIKAGHDDGCRFRIASTCAVGIECDHGRDVCPTCDPCTCAPAKARA